MVPFQQLEDGTWKHVGPGACGRVWSSLERAVRCPDVNAVEVTAEIDANAAAVKAAQATADNARAMVLARDPKMAEAMQALASVEQQIAAIIALQSDLKISQERLAALAADYQAALQASLAQRGQLRVDVDALRSDVTTLTARVAALSGELRAQWEAYTRDAVAAAVAAEAALARAAEAGVESRSRDLVAGERVRAQAAEGAESSRAQAAEAALASRATTLETRASTVEARATTLEGKTSALETRATAVEGRAASLEARATALEAKRVTIQTRVVTAAVTVAVGGSTDLQVTWDAPFPSTSYTVIAPQLINVGLALLGKLSASVTGKTAAGVTVRVASSALLSATQVSVEVTGYQYA